MSFGTLQQPALRIDHSYWEVAKLGTRQPSAQARIANHHKGVGECENGAAP